MAKKLNNKYKNFASYYFYYHYSVVLTIKKPPKSLIHIRFLNFDCIQFWAKFRQLKKKRLSQGYL
jgi:hypothetical protein